MELSKDPPPGTKASAPRTRPSRPHPKLAAASGDLGFELYRQHTLLVILATGLRRTSEHLSDPLGLELHRIQRALEVHRDYLLQVHYPDVEQVNAALEPKRDPRVFDGIVECKAEHPRGEEFQRRVSDLLSPTQVSTPETVRALAQAFRQEADRIEMHLSREEELLDSHLGEWLPRPRQARLLQRIRRFDAPRIAAEISLLVWASEMGPSAD